MRAATIALLVWICLPAMAGAQTAPNLTRQQRDHLQSLVTAVDAAAAAPSTIRDEGQWRTHRMRASDGSHYVAFTAVPPEALPPGPVVLYVRLATRPVEGGAARAERSAVREWLAGSRTDPRLLPRRNLAIGDMPAFGAGGIAVRGSTPSTGSTDLRLMALERERAKQEQDERDKQRRSELEGRQNAVHDLLPFEDFDLAAQPAPLGTARAITRALTAGPGDYDLYVAWVDSTAPRTAGLPRVIHQALTLPVARTAGLSTSDVILADSVAVRAAPYPPSEQASHPYSIGPMEVSPNRLHRFNREGDLAIVLQVINAQSTEAGMPDVAVTIRIVKIAGDRETPAASLNPHLYNETTLAPDFNLRLGHPLFAAITAPLATLSRGDYRAKIIVTDRIAGVSTGTDADFSIAATPSSLLADAPSLARPFRREAVLTPATIEAVVTALMPAQPSPALGRALATARNGKLVDLLVEEPVPPAEGGIRSALSGLAYLSVGDASAAVLLQRALDQQAPAGPVQFLIGCARAAQGRDADAVTAWRASIASGSGPAIASLLLVEGLFRQRNSAEASGVTPPGAAGSTPDWIRLDAAIKISMRREPEAASTLATYLVSHPEDQDARWLFLHARYAQFVRGIAPLSPVDRDAFRAQARLYLDANGPNSALLRDWLANF